MRQLKQLLSLCLLAGLASAGGAAEGTDNGLTVRLLPVESPEGAPAMVGAPIELRVEYENKSKNVMWVVGQVHADLRLVYISRPGRVLHGRGGSAPMDSSLVKLQPGATFSFLDSIAPPMSGRADVSLSLSNSSKVIREYASPTASTTRTVPRAGLWQGSIHVHLPITVRKGRGLGSAQRDADFARIRAERMKPVEAVHKWTQWATSVPDERLVDALRARLRMNGVRAFERMACIGQLVVTVHHGFGLRALPDLVDLAGDANAPAPERVLALEALVVAREGRVQASSGRVLFNLTVPDETRDRAVAVLDKLADDGSPELRRVAKRVRGD